MSKSKISRDEMRRRIEAKEGGEGVGGQESAPASPPVEVTVWAGWENYECRLCAYATLDPAVMAGHLKAVHGWSETTSYERRVTSEEALADGSPLGEISQDEVM